MKNLFLSVALFFGVISPVQAQENEPSMMAVRLGHLSSDGSTVVATSTENDQSITIHLSGCVETWNDGQVFVLVKGTDGTVVAIRGDRLFYTWKNEANQDWNTAIDILAKSHRICLVK
jgi:small nuclear ribonucleoprotein (snRNP)-like protein